MTHHQKNNGGFTLIELLVVIAIIGVLSGIALQSLSYARAKSRNAVRASDIDQIHKALELYAVRGEKFPNFGTTWKCIGKTSCTSILSGTLSNGAALDAALAGNMSKIPTEPKFTTNVGDAYLYSSDTTVSGVPGTYLFWVSENIGQGASRACGRGINTSLGTNGYWCFLRIGNVVQ